MFSSKLFPGLGLIALLVVLSGLAARRPELSVLGASPLTLAILLGAMLGNLRPTLAHGSWQPGLRFAQKVLLRGGVALYGFNLNLQQIAEAGRSGLLIDVLMLCSTLAVGYFVGTRWLRMEPASALLIAAGSAICGAAAIVATVSVLRLEENDSVRKAAAAVATVVLFGTAAMFLYPLLFAWLGGSRPLFGIFIGSTVHEVAQVVAIGNAIGGAAAHNAVIIKMIRVLMLVPFLLGLSLWLARGEPEAQQRNIAVPWFALIFVLFAALNSLFAMPDNLLHVLRQSGVICLSFAMAAFGMETTLTLIRQAGLKPLLLGAILFAYLVIVGSGVNFWLAG
ncbi:MAG: hypothetical protein H6R16_3373 [Proteobacteria bacterium]|nr:hypothetical protein [Pseudomonadota bacterium]